MNIKKQNTVKKHEKIYSDIENLMHSKKVSTVWDACGITAKKLKMTTPSVSVIYYNIRKCKKEVLQEINL